MITMNSIPKSLKVASSRLYYWIKCFSSSSVQVEFAGHSNTWLENHLIGAKLCWKNTSTLSRLKLDVLHNLDLINTADQAAPPTSANDMTPQNHPRLWEHHTELQTSWILCLPPDCRTLISNWNANLLASENRTLDHWATAKFLILSPGNTVCFWDIQEWLDIWIASPTSSKHCGS